MPANLNDPRVLDAMRKLSGEQRLRLQRSLIAMGYRLVEAGVRREHPDWDDDRVRDAVRDRVIRSREHYAPNV
jgi:hypothetical protein